MTDDKDRRLLLSLLSIFYNWELIREECYSLCEGDMYYVPAHGPHKVQEGAAAEEGCACYRHGQAFVSLTAAPNIVSNTV